MGKILKEKFNIKIPFTNAKFLAIVLIVLGLIQFFFIPSFLNIKLWAAAVFLGLFISLVFTEEESFSSLLISKKITLVTTIWILFVLVITLYFSVEVFFVLMGAGILALKVFSNEFISYKSRKGFNIIVVGLIVIYAIIFAQKIMDILIN